MERAVEREVGLDVPLQPVDDGSRAADPGLEVGRIADRLAMVFQWPGGVSELGPSAQNSASARAKSPSSTTSGA